jgi:hypothetical protein
MSFPPVQPLPGAIGGPPLPEQGPPPLAGGASATLPPPPLPPPGLLGGAAGANIPTMGAPATPKVRRREVAKPQKRVKGPATPRPDPNQIVAWAHEDFDYWQPRNNRMREDQLLYEMSNPTYLKDKDTSIERIIRNTPWRLVEKISNVIGAQDPRIKVPPRAGDTADAAEKIEDFLGYWRIEDNIRWMQGVHAPIGREKAHFGALRGWVTGLIGNNPRDKNFPWVHTLHDPINIYPRPGTNGLHHVTQQYEGTASQVAQDFPQFAKEIEYYFEGQNTAAMNEAGSSQANSTAHVVAYYDAFWWALLLDGQLITLKKHNYGFNPWIIAIAGGSAVRSSDTYDPLHTEWIGTSVMQGIKRSYRSMNTILTQMATQVRKAADPAVNVHYISDLGTPETIKTTAGARNFFKIEGNQKEFAELFDPTATPAEAQQVLQALAEDINLGGLPPVLYGEGAPNLAGYAITLLNAAARDIFFPITACIENYDTLLYRRVLELFEEYGADSVQFVGTKLGKRAAYGNEIKPDDVTQNGTFVKVEFGNIMPQDIIAMGNLGVQLVDGHIVDRDWVRDHIAVDDTERMKRKVYAEMINLDEGFVKTIKIPEAIAEMDPAYLDWWLEHNPDAGGGGGGGPVPGQNGVPAASPGLPTNVIPPQMQSQGYATNPQGGPNPGMPPLPPDVAAMIRNLRGGAP